MNKFKKYVYKQRNIENIDTYLIYPEYYKEVITLLNLHTFNLTSLDIIKKVNTVELYPALLYIPRFVERYRWQPILCYKNDKNIYHIQYHNNWICRECGTNNGSVIMPLSEADTTYYTFPLPPIPEIFQKIPCKKCGKLLQNHLIMLNND